MTADQTPPIDRDQRLPAGKLPSSLLATLLQRRSIDDPRVLVGPGIGRDAAAIDLGPLVLVVKNDPITFATDQAPHYLVNVNANDLACLGATPAWMLVTALLPPDSTTVGSVETLFSQLAEACDQRGIAIVGGHTEMTDAVTRPVLVGMLVGTTDRSRLLQPGGGRPGDRLLLTRPISIEGTALLARELARPLSAALGADLVARAANLLDDPGISVVDDAATLLQTGAVRALHDPTEGGLASGIREIAEVSGCGAIVARGNIGTLPETDSICRHLGIDPMGLLASGSLLAAIDPAGIEAVDRACSAAGIPATWIGKLAVAERGFRMTVDGVEGELPEFAADEVTRVL